MNHPRLFVATKVFIIQDGKVLLVRESGDYDDGTHVNEYDVVGGRLTPGEQFKEALHREVKEEVGLDIKLGAPFFVNEWRPEVKGEKWQIIGIFFEAEALSSDISLSKDHADYIWIDPSEYKDHPIIKNLQPVFEAYLTKSIN